MEKLGWRQSNGSWKRSHIVVCHCSPDTPRSQKHPYRSRKNRVSLSVRIRLADFVKVTSHEKDRRHDCGRCCNAVGSSGRFTGSYDFAIKMLRHDAFSGVAIEADLRIFIFMKDTEMLLYSFEIDDRHIRLPLLRPSARL